MHWSLPDPSAATGEIGERMEAFRAVRDTIRTHILSELVDQKVGSP